VPSSGQRPIYNYAGPGIKDLRPEYLQVTASTAPPNIQEWNAEVVNIPGQDVDLSRVFEVVEHLTEVCPSRHTVGVQLVSQLGRNHQEGRAALPTVV
jgi:hypothetical protein